MHTFYLREKANILEAIVFTGQYFLISFYYFQILKLLSSILFINHNRFLKHVKTRAGL